MVNKEGVFILSHRIDYDPLHNKNTYDKVRELYEQK